MSEATGGAPRTGAAQSAFERPRCGSPDTLEGSSGPRCQCGMIGVAEKAAPTEGVRRGRAGAGSYLRTLVPTLAASGTANGRRGKSSRSGGWRIVGVILAPVLGPKAPCCVTR